MINKREKKLFLLFVLIATFSQIYNPVYSMFLQHMYDCPDTMINGTEKQSKNSKIIFVKLMFNFSKTYQFTPAEYQYRLAGLCTDKELFLKEEQQYYLLNQKALIYRN